MELTRPDGKTVFHNDCISESRIRNDTKYGLYKMMEFCLERPHQLTLGNMSKTRSIYLHNRTSKNLILTCLENKSFFKITFMTRAQR